MSRTLKISTLDQAEDYINRQNNQLNNLKSQLNGVESRAKQEAREEARRRVQVVQQNMDIMEHTLNNQLSGLDSEMRSNYQEHRRALRQQAIEFNANLNNLQDWTESTINNLRNDVNNKFQEQQGQIDNNRQRINNIFQKEADLKKQAQLRLNNLKVLLDIVDKNNNHDKYANGEWLQIKRRVDTLSNSSLPAEAVIAQTLGITNDLYDLEEKISKEKTIFEAKHNAILKLAQELLKTMHDNRTELYFTDEEGKELKDENDNKIQIEVDFWTENEYQKLEKNAKTLEKELIDTKENVELDDNRLDDLHNSIEQIKRKQNDLVVIACEKGLASEERIIISDDLVNAFMEQGFSLKNGIESHNYMGSEENKTETDLREGVMAVLKNGVGTEITLIIHPDKTGTKNHIIFHRNNDQNDLTEEEYMASLEKVRKFIEDRGYNMGNLTAPKGTGDVRLEALADENALKKVGLKKELKKELGL